MVTKRDNNGQPIPLIPPPSVAFKDKQGNNATGCSYDYRPDIGATIATVTISLASGALVIKHSVGGAVNGI